MKKLRLIAACCAPLWLASCATPTPPSSVEAAAPAQWQAPLPHGGTLTELSLWWQQLNDPLLAQLIDAAQAVNPNLATARSRIEQARATRTAAGAALLPALDGSLNASRGLSQSTVPATAATTVQGGLQAGWEIDLFGGNRSASNAAQLRLDGAQALWHDARVSVAAEVANQYFSLRTCERQLSVAQRDATSRAETARLADLAARAGFQAPAEAALARASAAEASARLTQQRALCDVDVKVLVQLTALPEPQLRQQLASSPSSPALAASFAISSVPAQALAQRPDIFYADREVAAASADVGFSQAQRFPRLTLGGSVGTARVRAGGVTSELDTWSIGPLALTVPIFDGGRRAADVDAARARYDEAAALYRARVRQAVREVEEALVNLQSTGARNDDAVIATEGYRQSFAATEARYRSGLASLVELEDSRRTALAAETALVTLQRERVAAWIALYRAVGGGWTPQTPAPSFAAAPGPQAAPVAAGR
ncbi:MAG: efflux transporter outer membrane subunit [Comamonadaceae bacterium]|nr:MAG: efflux transporter outer membrane subunit [Comamonadaceae bacterium]